MSFGDFLRNFAQSAGRFEQERRAREEQRYREEEDRRRMDDAMRARIAAVRVITGDIKYKYAIVNTVRAWAYVPYAPGRQADPHKTTDIAIYNLQREAMKMGADAVIHAQFHILRYEVTLRDGKVPAYETHAFGTAVKILAPPDDWKTPDGGPGSGEEN